MPKDTIKIPLYKPIYGEKPITIKSLKINDDGNTEVITDRKEAEGLNPKAQLTFRRFADRGERVKVLSGSLTILENKVDENGNAKLILEGVPQPDRLYLVDTIYSEELDGEWSLVDRELTDEEISAGLEDETLSIYESPYYELSDDKGEFLGTVVRFKTDHNIFLQDLNGNAIKPQIIAYNVDDKKIGTYDVSILKSSGYSIADCDDLKHKTIETDCNGNEKENVTYTYLPEDFLTDEILLVGVRQDAIKNAAYFQSTQNCFFDENGKLYGFGCRIDEFKEETVFLNRDYAFWNVPVQMESDNDPTSLGLSDVQEEQLVNGEINRNIPPIINMEKIKYAPMFKDESGKLQLLTEIEINMHFRKRAPLSGATGMETANWEEIIKNGKDIGFEDGWYIDPDNESETGWFEEEDGKSDLLGYFGFDDNDIFFQKAKISKSFVRLSYYDRNDPVNQSLLNYSTVFFDSGEIYGKYLKQKQYIEQIPEEKRWKYAVGLCSDEGYRVDSQITITNEHDKTKCAEGFNIYLFAEDAPLGDEEVPENGILEEGKNYEKPIYLKVEFNNAKNGKTIPLVASNDDIAVKKSESDEGNILDILYIKILTGYNIDQGIYYYRIPQSKHIKIDGTKLILTLFEPKLKRGE